MGNGLHVDHIFKVFQVRSHQVDLGGGIRCHGFVERNAIYILHVVGNDLVGAILDPFGRASICGTAIGRVVFETAIFRWVMGRRDHHAIGKRLGEFLIESQNSMRDDRCGSVFVILVDANIHTIAGKNLNGSIESRFRKGVRVHAHEKRTADAFTPPVFDDRLCDSGNMIIVEAAIQGTSAMPGGAEGDLLAGFTRFGVNGVISGHQAGNIGEIFDGGGFTGERMNAHEDSCSSIQLKSGL